MINIIHQLRIAKGTKKKLRILQDHANNEEWLQFLSCTYDTGINYHVSAPSELTFLDSDPDYEGMFRDLLRLSTRKITGNKARALALELSECYGEMARLVLKGSINAGVGIETINKAYPGLIPTYGVMLAKDVVLTRYPVLASTKFDGVRCIVRVEGGRAHAITRNGKVLHLTSLLESMNNQSDGVYDGELVLGDGLQADRTRITGAVNKVLFGTRDDIDNYTYCIFDRVELTDWDAKSCNYGYLERLQRLSISYEFSPYVEVVQQTNLSTPREVNALFEHRINSGYEGLILRYSDHPYLWKRSDYLIKKKAIKECTLRCTGTLEGTGKYAGMIGALLCQGIAEGKDIKVKVGTGFTDIDRDYSPAHYIGKDIEIDYNDIVRAKLATWHSLFLPRFKRVITKEAL